MFLDDELLQIARNADDTTMQGITDAVSKMINACFNNLQERIAGNTTDEVIISNFYRVDNTWKLVAKKLELENKCFIRSNGFRRFVESKPEFKNVFFK
jgi:hypothetical protein